MKVIKLDIDRYGRAIAESFLNDTINLSYQMVKAGFAWQYKKYSKDQKLAELETMARKNRLGLWADENHTPPWELRDDRRIGRKDSEK
ncbi:MAG: thermonuclease family protein [Bacteroidetes bacterium]|nr:thermonuclease family protein [Bacteroidota bacterium]